MNTKCPKPWYSTISAADMESAAQEAFVDAHGEHERHSGVLTMIEERLAFPFQARVIAAEVTVVGMSWPDANAFGLDLIVEGANGNQYFIVAESVEPLTPFPVGVEFLAVYLEWLRCL